MEIVTCLNCGHGNPEGTVHCVKCGERLRTAPPASKTTYKRTNNYFHFEGRIFSGATIADKLQTWADRLAIIAIVLCVIGIDIGFIIFIVNIEKCGSGYGGYYSQKELEARNAVSTGITCAIGSIIGIFFSLITFGGLFAFGTHLETNQELLSTQKRLLEVGQKQEEELAKLLNKVRIEE